MKKRRIQDLVPVGIDFWQSESRWILGGLIASAAWSLVTPYQYMEHRKILLNSLRYQSTNAFMIPFSELAQPGVSLFGVFFLAMVLLGLTHMQFHRKRSMSVYLMKRLPNPREYRIRCWGVPVLASLAALAEMALLFGIYYLIYLKFTPAQCLLAMYRS